ncbi:hypothetical protein [Novipirellula artificiosorum]|uniref:Putative metal-binding domain of cation transport ATPase n=1 Tax=Novipirellula artificiosorum TaxID=2528016 RepID=A0A5C6DF66_9BACT|nr:hypothetical protein [Novipirellula artificiosorum]TWU34875.1 putative metal-binding domain of cation transport ATPase [Novipirellula artificiosorum]
MKMRNLLAATAVATTTLSFSPLASAQMSHADHDHGAMQHAQSSHDHTAMTESPETSVGPHGGTVQMVGSRRIETVLVPKGIMFMILNSKGEPIAPPDVEGTVSLRVGNNPKLHTYQMRILKNQAVGVAVDLSKVTDQALHMDVEITNIAAKPVSFHSMSKVIGSSTGAGLSDEELIALQGVCPISGKPLGSMGQPPKVMVNGKSLFVCCGGCSGKVEASPDQYFTKFYSAEGEEVRPGVFKSTLADAAAIAAQKTCPVMDEKLGGMGVPLKVNVKGKAVYICCAGCAKKLAAEPDKYLQKLSQSGVTPPAM